METWENAVHKTDVFKKDDTLDKHSVILQIFGVVLFSVFSGVNGLYRN